jgi:hypothetical protein
MVTAKEKDSNSNNDDESYNWVLGKEEMTAKHGIFSKAGKSTAQRNGNSRAKNSTKDNRSLETPKEAERQETARTL